jgi:peptidyl-prolyl cis-trans isomerase D
MMRQMRENTKWIMLVTALAFVALMVFEWGMDMTGRSAGGVGEIGRVNGSPVMYDAYMASYRNLYDRVQDSQEEPITSQRNREIEDAAFDEVVSQILIQQELERRGIRVTNEEIRQAARTSPPAEFRQLPLFQTDGQFDLQKYQSYITSPQADQQTLLYLEAYFRDVIPRGKLMRQITSGLYFTDAELWRQWKADRETVSVQYVALNPSARVADEEVQISDREIETYYDDNQEEFEVPARAQVRAVVLNKAPTPADSAAALEEARQARQDILDGADFAEVAETRGEAGAASQGGEMGVIPPRALLSPLDSVVLALDEGELSDPVRSQFGYHVMQVQEAWGQDSVRARQVLIPIDRTEDSEIALLTMADSLEDLSETRPLSEAAEILGVEIQETEITDDLAVVPGAGQVGEGSDWAFQDAAPGDVSPVFENGQAFYALELIESTPGGILPLAEARPSIEQTLRLEKKIDRSLEEAEGLVDRMRSTSMANVASEAGLEIRSAGPFARTGFVPGIGRQNAAVGAAFGLDVGEVSAPVTANQNVFVLQTLQRTEADSAAWREQLQAQRQTAQVQVQEQRIQEWLEGLRADARILDRREEVLQPADEQEPLRSTGPLGF